MYVYSWFGRFSPRPDPDEDPDDDRDGEPAHEPVAPAMPTASRTRGHGDRQEQQDAVEHAPAHRAEDPLADPEQRRPMTSRKTAKTTRMKASAPRAMTRPTSPAIAAASALARSMWATTRAIAASRVAPSWARRPGGGTLGPRLDGGGGGGGGVRGGGSVGIWSSRGVLRLRDRMRGSAAMIAAHRARPVAGNASRYAAGHVRCGLAATPDGRAAEHRQRADGRRDARHERRGDRSLADRSRRPGDPADRAAGRPRRGHRCLRRGARAVGPGHLDRRPRSDPGRPDPRGDRRRVR